MSTIRYSFVALSLVTLAACATGHEAMRGSVVMKVSGTEAHVCLLAGDARIGSRVQLYRHTCVTKYARSYQCEKQPVAVGTVSERMGDHYALVTFPQGTAFEEGYTVEPIN
jgi:hypothetical protein